MKIELEEAITQIRAGEIIAFPTETFYGFGVDPANDQAVQKLLGLKERSSNAGIPLIINDPGLVGSWIMPEEPQIRLQRAKLQGAFWPGPLTIVFPVNEHARESLSEAVFGPGETLALRISSEPTAVMLAEELGGAITATSANEKGKEPPKTADEVEEAFPDIPVVTTNYPRESQPDQPSTIVDVRALPFKVIRPGAISEEEMFQALED